MGEAPGEGKLGIYAWDKGFLLFKAALEVKATQQLQQTVEILFQVNPN